MNTRFREVRKNMHLTQKEVANMLNVSHTTYNRYESGLIEPDIGKLCKMANIFRVTVDYLLMNDIPTLTKEIDESDMENIVFKYQQLDKRGKDAVYNTLMREYEFSKLESIESLRLNTLN